MFKKIERGLPVFKRAMKVFLLQRKNKEYFRQERKKEFGVNEPKDIDWEAKELWRLNSMASVLGLSKDEIKKIQIDIEKLIQNKEVNYL
jgi:hypothetical protein